MEELSFEEFSTVLVNGEMLYSDGKLVLQHKTDGELYFAAPEVVCPKSHQVPKEDVPGTSNTNPKCRWTHNAIIALINERINMDQYFKSTTSKSETKWKQLANKLGEQGFNLTPTQCNDKWRYLKGKYARKKDNLGDKATGESPVDFEYFPLLDSCLRKKHQITPVATASSTRGNTVPEDTENVLSDDDTEVAEPDKKIRKISSKITQIKQKKNVCDTLLTEMRTKEINRQQRHEELLNLRKMDALLEILKK